MSVRENAGRGKSFWGLVEQVGPWKETAQDRRNKSSPYGIGTGTSRQGRGGVVHAGHGSFDSLTVPGCVSGRKPPPKPSVYAQRSVVYKPLVFDGPVGIAGRMGIRQAHLKGLGDRANTGSDQGVQTSGNVLGVGVPARQNLSAISQQEAIQQKSEMRLAELQQHNKVEAVNPLVQHANKVFGSGSSVRQTGTFGSAAGMTPHPGTEVAPGESVGGVLRKATGEAGKFAGIVAPIPILGAVAGAGAAGLGVAAGAVSAGEALGEGDIAGAISHGQDAYREAIRLQNITGQVTENWNRNSGAFNTAASEYHTAEGGSMATDPSLDRRVNKWLDEYEVDSLADLESELERLIETENGKSKEAIQKILTEVKQVAASEYHTAEGGSVATDPSLDRRVNKWLDEYEVDSLADLESELERLIETEKGKSKEAIQKILTEVKQVAVDYPPQGKNLNIVHGESVTFLPIKTGVSGGTQTGGGSKTQGTGTDNIYSFTKEFGTQADYTDAEKEKLKVELGEAIDALEAGKTEIVLGNVRMARLLEIFGVDGEPFFQAVQRGEIDHASDLLREAREVLGVRYGAQGFAQDLTENDWYNTVVAHENQKRQGGLAQVGSQTIFVPPRQNLVDQATDMTNETASKLGKRKERYIDFGAASGGGQRRRLNPVNRIEARGGSLKGRGVQQVNKAKKAPEGSLRNLAYKALPRLESYRNK